MIDDFNIGDKVALKDNLDVYGHLVEIHGEWLIAEDGPKGRIKLLKENAVVIN